MKRQVLLVMIGVLGLIALWRPMEASAAALNRKEIAAIQGAVRLQIVAIKKGDAASAFALTTADTRERLGTADNFLRVIKEQYDPVYRHRLALYSVPKLVMGKIYQLVRLTDLDNHVWLAIYLMHKEADGAWKIDGCELVETSLIAV